METPTFANLLGTLALTSYVITLAPTTIKIIFPIVKKSKIITFSLKYRRQIGVIAFILALIHGWLFFIKRRIDLLDFSTYWIYIQGISTLIIFTLLDLWNTQTGQLNYTLKGNDYSRADRSF